MFLLTPKKPKKQRTGRGPNRYAGSVAENIRRTRSELSDQRTELRDLERRQTKQEEAFKDIAHHVKQAEFNAAGITARYAGFDRACHHFENAAKNINRNRQGLTKDDLACAGAEIKQVIKKTRDKTETLKHWIRVFENELKDLQCR